MDDTVFTDLVTFPSFKEVIVLAALAAIWPVGQFTLFFFWFCWLFTFLVRHKECFHRRNDTRCGSTGVDV